MSVYNDPRLKDSGYRGAGTQGTQSTNAAPSNNLKDWVTLYGAWSFENLGKEYYVQSERGPGGKYTIMGEPWTQKEMLGIYLHRSHYAEILDVSFDDKISNYTTKGNKLIVPVFDDIVLNFLFVNDIGWIKDRHGRADHARHPNEVNILVLIIYSAVMGLLITSGIKYPKIIETMFPTTLFAVTSANAVLNNERTHAKLDLIMMALGELKRRSPAEGVQEISDNLKADIITELGVLATGITTEHTNIDSQGILHGIVSDILTAVGVIDTNVVAISNDLAITAADELLIRRILLAIGM